MPKSLTPVPRLTVDTACDAETFVVAVSGELDLATVAILRAACRRGLASPAPEIVVDLSFCEFIDSTALAELLHLHRRVRHTAGRELVLLPGPPAVQRVFTVCGLSDVLPFGG